MRLPFAKSALQATEAFAWALTPPPDEDGVPGLRHHPSANSKAKKKQPFTMQQAADKENAAPAMLGAPTEADHDSDYDDLPPLIPAATWEVALGVADQSGIPSGALCQLSGSLMTDPVASPEGHLFERAALEDWTTQHGSNPVTGTPLQIHECTDQPHIQSYIQGYQMQTLSACQVSPESFGAGPAASPFAAPAPVPTTGPSLLGDLPSLGNNQPQTKKKEKSKIRIESRSVVECPDDMRCAIDGKVMINPVRSPYGHFFEKKTLERWMGNCGSVCPVSGQILRLEDCQPDAEMKKRIVKFLKGQP